MQNNVTGPWSRHFSNLTRAALVAVAGALPAPVLAQGAGLPPLACLQLVEALANDGRVPLQGVHFDFNRATLRPESLPAMIAARDAILTLGGTWTFEGHTDNVGSQGYNQQLSEARALAVRDWMVGAGIDPAQIAHAGFSFDRPIADNATEAGRALNRRVEMVGTVNADMLGFGGPDGADPCPDTLIPGTHMATSDAEAPPPPPPITEWTGAGGQEWLPFSSLAATAMGGGTGWEGNRITMPPGTQPQACQAMCLAEDLCAAFSFEPAGSHFVSDARCVLIGYGTELRLDRNNGYFAAGDFWASGLKPDARLLTPESEAVATQILADMAEIAALRASVQLSAASQVAPEAWLDVALDGHVAPALYPSFVEIAELDDYDFDWSKSRGNVFVHDMADGRSGQIWTPAPGDYVLRYGINHPTAGMHTITSQPLLVRASAVEPAVTTPQTAPAVSGRSGTIEPGIDRPGMDLAQIPMSVADPLVCQALCAGDPNCQAWTYVTPGLQGDQAVCWTKSGIPEGFANPCCTSGVMDQAAAPPASTPPDATGAQASASLAAPMVVAPGEMFLVTYSGPLLNGDWIDIITPGNDTDMSGGWSWAYVTGNPVTLTAPNPEGTYTLRYVAEDPQQGRVVLARETLVVRVTPAETVAQADIFRRCDGPPMTTCDLVLPSENIVLTLLTGFGITEPIAYVTAGGIAAERPGFDVVRLSDGEVVVTVNARQGAGLYCQENLSGDRMCITQALDGNEGMLAGLVLGSLTSHDLYVNAMARGEEDLIDAGDAQGIWTAATQDGPEAGRSFLRLDLIHDAGSDVVDGGFLFAADFPPLPGGAGTLEGRLIGDSLTLILTDDATGSAPMLALTRYGGADWLGTLSVSGQALSVRVSLRAGPAEVWDEPLAWTAPDGMAAALRMGAEALGGALGDMSAEDRAFMDLLGQMMGGVADTLQGGADSAAPMGDMAAMLGQLFGATSPGGAATGTASTPQMTALGGSLLDLTADEAILLLVPHLGE